MPNNESCRLCQSIDTLCESHVIPEFFYKPLYDEKHRFFTVSSKSETKDLTLQKGLRERLLCVGCEGRFAKYEKYFSELSFGGIAADYTDDGRNLHIAGIDYPKVKLLFLSVLWRMSISSLDFFREVSLGPHEKRIRQMLLADDPGARDEYGVTAVAPYFDSKYLGHFVTRPDFVRVEANRVYRLIMGGVLYFFHVPGRSLPEAITRSLPSPEGTWVIRRERIEDIEFLFHYTLEIGKGIAGREG